MVNPLRPHESLRFLINRSFSPRQIPMHCASDLPRWGISTRAVSLDRSHWEDRLCRRGHTSAPHRDWGPGTGDRMAFRKSHCWCRPKFLGDFWKHSVLLPQQSLIQNGCHWCWHYEFAQSYLILDLKGIFFVGPSCPRENPQWFEHHRCWRCHWARTWTANILGIQHEASYPHMKKNHVFDLSQILAGSILYLYYVLLKYIYLNIYIYIDIDIYIHMYISISGFDDVNSPGSMRMHPSSIPTSQLGPPGRLRRCELGLDRVWLTA